ncbi:MAG: hypothetical protein HPY44_13425 [Armatimonadetes bacterium]|nr:hypothetical protein [Armatimonadota bacterium]
MRRLPLTAIAGLAVVVLSAGFGQAAPEPVTGAVVCHGVTPKGQPISPTSWFPKGARAIYVWFRAGDVPPGTRAQIRWSLNGGTLKTDEVVLNAGRPAWSRYEIALGEPLPVGRYEAQVTVGDSAPVRVSARVGGDEPLADETRAVQPTEPASPTGVSALSRSDRASAQPAGGARLARAASPEPVAPVIGPSAPAPSSPSVGMPVPAVVTPAVDAIAPEEAAPSPVVVTGPSLADAPPAGPPPPSGILARPTVGAPELAVRIAPETPAVVDDSLVLRVTDPAPAISATTWTAGAGIVPRGEPTQATTPAPVAAAPVGPAITIPEAGPGVVTFFPPVLAPAGTVPEATGTVPPASPQPAGPAPDAAAPTAASVLSAPLGPRTQPSGGAQPVVMPRPADEVASTPAGPSVVPSTVSGASIPRPITPVRVDEPEAAADDAGSRPLISRSASGREPTARSARRPESDAGDSQRSGSTLLLPTRPKARPIPGGPAPDEPIVEAPPAEVKPLLASCGSSGSAEPTAAVGDYVPITVPPAAPGESVPSVERPAPVTAPPAPEVPVPVVPQAGADAHEESTEPGAAATAPPKAPTPDGDGAREPAGALAETPTTPPATAPRDLVLQAPLIAGIAAEDLPPVELSDTAVKLHYVELTATPEPAGLQPMWIVRAPDGRLWPPGMPTQLGLFAGDSPDPDPSTLLLYSDHVDGITPLYEVTRGEAMLHAVRENDAALLYVSRDMFDQRRQAWLETARDWRWMWYVRQVDLSIGQSVTACLCDLTRSRRVPEFYQATGRPECVLIGPNGQRISPSTVTPQLCAALSPSIEGAQALPVDDPGAFVAGLEARGVSALTTWTAPSAGRYQVWAALPIDRAAASCKVWLEK